MMEKRENVKMTREEALRRFEASRKRKHDFVEKLEKKMKAEYKKRTGQDATFFEVW